MFGCVHMSFRNVYRRAAGSPRASVRMCCIGQDKDLFREHYCVMLSKRLLLQKSVSNDIELATIVKLKALCGPQYTKKIEDMLADLKVSEDAKQV